METREILEMVLESGRGLEIEVNPSIDSKAVFGVSTTNRRCELRIRVDKVEVDDEEVEDE